MNIILNYINSLKGRKTYLLSIFAVFYGISGWYIGQLDSNNALQFIWGGLTSAALRAGISK